MFLEKGLLLDKGFKAEYSKGRRYESSRRLLNLPVCPYEIDVQAILNSKALRRLGLKAQVFPTPKNPHVRVRLSHTNEVVAIASIIADILGLNAALCRAIAYGHDIGHIPFGHVGEEALSYISKLKIRHEVLSCIIAQKVERRGNGLNLTFETLEGILKHSRGSGKLYANLDDPLEYTVVMYADKIAYTFSDLNDLLRNGINIEEGRTWIREIFGANHRDRIDTCIEALVNESVEKGQISFEESEVAVKFKQLRNLMYKHAYPGIIKKENVVNFFKMAMGVIDRLQIFQGCDPNLVIALMTEAEIYSCLPMAISDHNISLEQVKKWGVYEIKDYITGISIDLTDPDLKWGTRTS